MTGKMFGGINVASCFYLTLDDIDCQRVGADSAGVRLAGINATSKVVNVWMTAVKITAGVAATETTGLYIDSYAEGIYADRCAFESTGLDYGIYIRNTQGAPRPPENLFFSQCVCDYPAQSGMVIESAYTAHFTQCWFATANAGEGVWVAGGQDIKLLGCLVIANAVHGIRIGASATQVRVQGCIIDANSASSSNTHPAIAVDANATDFIITGNDFTRAGTTPSHKHSVLVINGTSDRYVIAHNNLSGFVTSALSDGGSGTNKVVGSNVT
jgi:hypothetical protein